MRTFELKDTEGLMITNDGPLAHELLSQRNMLKKVLHVELYTILTKDIAKIESGVTAMV